MNHRTVQSLLLALVLALAGSLAAAADPAGAGVITVKEGADGGVVLSNDGPATASAPSNPAAAADAGNAGLVRGAKADQAAAGATARGAADSPPAKDLREVYRDRMIQGADSTLAANPALSRRYKAMDRATYNATMSIADDTSKPRP